MTEDQLPASAASAPVLLVERPDPSTAILTLNRPQRRNALSLELLEALCRTLETLAAEPHRRALILRGNGPGFCGGLDLHEAAECGPVERHAPWVARAFELLATSPLVTLAAAHGSAYAGGAGLLACCDFVVAAEDLQMCFPEVRRGLVPALVTALIGDRLRDRDLRELFFLAEPVDAARALSMGLVQRVVPRERVLPETEALLAKILEGAPEAVRHTKRLLAESRATRLEQRLAWALKAHQQARHSAEGREGIAAFREHRQPNWPEGIE